jgi:hypothetical protein
LPINPTSIAVFKIQVDEADNGVWHNVLGADGKLLTFASSVEAHQKLEQLFPVLTKTEKYVGPKRTRVIAIIDND